MESIESKNEKIIGNEKIGPTAFITALYRTFSDIPYAQEIFNALEKLRIIESESDIPIELKKYERSPLIEARYKIDSKLISENNSHQILEIASGLSPRGLDMSSNKDLRYVEIDLPEVIKLKKEIVSSIKDDSNKELNDNLFFESGDALNENDLLKSTNHFKEKERITILNEGLLAYLNFEEKTILSKNIQKLLSVFGGVWITPDIILPENKEKDNTKNTYNKNLQKLTGSTIDANRFKDKEEAKKFFEDIGFDVEIHNFSEVYDQLVSPKKLNMKNVDVDNLIGSSVAFVMKLKKNNK